MVVRMEYRFMEGPQLPAGGICMGTNYYTDFIYIYILYYERHRGKNNM